MHFSMQQRAPATKRTMPTFSFDIWILNIFGLKIDDWYECNNKNEIWLPVPGRFEWHLHIWMAETTFSIWYQVVETNSQLAINGLST